MLWPYSNIQPHTDVLPIAKGLLKRGLLKEIEILKDQFSKVFASDFLENIEDMFLRFLNSKQSRWCNENYKL